MILLLISVFGLAAVNSDILHLKEGAECKTLDGSRGTCTQRSQCLTIEDIMRVRSVICSFKGFELIICCPPKVTARVIQGNKVEQYCTQLNHRYQNIQEVNKVLGGRESAPRTHTYMVLIGYKTTKEWRCGGTLITESYVLSAAHCSHPYELGPARWARLGELDISSSSDDAKPVDRTIDKRIPYPSYKASQPYHDIALFKLDSAVVFSTYIYPICLHTNRDITSKIATAMGWGRTSGRGSTSKKLLEVNIDVYNDTECMRFMHSGWVRILFRWDSDADQIICAGLPDGSKDTCEGDSGGPLAVLDPGKRIRTQIGITSFGKQCGNKDYPDSPGVYTRVSNYISWIEEVAFGDGNIS
ncbi:unnamed protein product [Nezara viridula]|uniref:Uncharacterized protein n=1 Tax=Nezara viridula TaxID=85310 RepID=A0A9P0MXC5_NEZVI|nr:unnamed protein product [Nezara viridula]